jgi:hypothetical protein
MWVTPLVDDCQCTLQNWDQKKNPSGNECTPQQFEQLAQFGIDKDNFKN